MHKRAYMSHFQSEEFCLFISEADQGLLKPIIDQLQEDPHYRNHGYYGYKKYGYRNYHKYGYKSYLKGKALIFDLIASTMFKVCVEPSDYKETRLLFILFEKCREIFKIVSIDRLVKLIFLLIELLFTLN